MQATIVKNLTIFGCNWQPGDLTPGVPEAGPQKIVVIVNIYLDCQIWGLKWYQCATEAVTLTLGPLDTDRTGTPYRCSHRLPPLAVEPENDTMSNCDCPSPAYDSQQIQQPHA